MVRLNATEVGVAVYEVLNWPAFFFAGLRVFGSVVVVAFQSAFHSEKYANNIFFIF
jgi:hypothetical protein